MNLIEISQISAGHSVICYQGSFDPPHKGHLSALEAAIEKTGAVAAVVIVCNGENSEKPGRSSWEIRREMAKTCFCFLPNVWVSEMPDKETKAILLKNRNIITLIGSDAWPRYSLRPNIPFDAICINLRYQESPEKYPTEIQGKKIICITSAIQGVSSTQLRASFKSNPQVYEKQKPQIPPYLLNTLQNQTLNFIIQENLYFQNRANRLEEIHKEIEDYLRRNIFNSTPFKLNFFTGKDPSPTDPRGKSGDLTFLACDNDKKLFIKVYITPDHHKNIEKEIKGIESLQHLSIENLKGPNPIYWKESNANFSHLGLPFFEEPDVASFLPSLQAPKNEIDQFCRICFCVGQALAGLHHAKIQPIQNKELEEKTELLNLRTKGRLPKLPIELQELASSSFYSSLHSFLENPGVHTYVHGDASLSNFLVDIRKIEIRLVDLESFSLAQTEEGEPLGFPAEDYHRFLGDLHWLNAKSQLSSETLASIEKAFEEGYLTLPSLITNEAHIYFSNYWKIRNYKTDKQSLDKLK